MSLLAAPLFSLFESQAEIRTVTSGQPLLIGPWAAGAGRSVVGSARPFTHPQAWMVVAPSLLLPPHRQQPTPTPTKIGH